MTKQQKWQQKNTTIMPIRLNHNTDKDILKHLETKESKAGYIKDLIRKDMEEQGVKIPHPSKAEQKRYAEYLCDLEFGEIDPKEDFVWKE